MKTHNLSELNLRNKSIIDTVYIVHGLLKKEEKKGLIEITYIGVSLHRTPMKYFSWLLLERRTVNPRDWSHRETGTVKCISDLNLGQPIGASCCID